jgi:hypothetical protein
MHNTSENFSISIAHVRNRGGSLVVYKLIREPFAILGEYTHKKSFIRLFIPRSRCKYATRRLITEGVGSEGLKKSICKQLATVF